MMCWLIIRATYVQRESSIGDCRISCRRNSFILVRENQTTVKLEELICLLFVCLSIVQISIKRRPSCTICIWIHGVWYFLAIVHVSFDLLMTIFCFISHKQFICYKVIDPLACLWETLWSSDSHSVRNLMTCAEFATFRLPPWPKLYMLTIV